MTSDLDWLIHSAPDEVAREFLDSLSPAEFVALGDDLPVPAGLIDAARRDTADPLAWADEWLPEIAPLEAGPHHRTIATLVPADKPRGVRAVAGAPRGSGKSTVLLSLVPLLCAVRRSHRFIVVIRDNLPDAVTAVAGLRRILEGHADLIARYPWLRPLPGPEGTLELAGGLVVMARSTGSAIRGLQRTTASGSIIRPDLVLCDDLEDEDSARSSLQVTRLREWLLSVVGQLGGPPGGEEHASSLDLVAIGTTLERDALISQALDGSGPFGAWQRYRFPAEVTVTSPLGLEVPEAHRTDDLIAVDAEGLWTPVPVPDGAAAGDRISLWPDGLPLPYLDRLTDPTDELFVGRVIYAREYLLRPAARSDTLFKPTATRYEHIAEDWLAGNLALTEAVVSVDPAISKHDAADYSAVTVVGLWRPDGKQEDGKPWRRRLLVPYAERRRVGPTDLLDWIEEVAETYGDPLGGVRVTFEAEGAFEWGADELRRRRSVSVRAVKSGGRDKRTRATPLSVWHESGRLVFDATIRGSDLVREFHGFSGTGTEEHDDLVDALVYGAEFVTNGWRRAD